MQRVRASARPVSFCVKCAFIGNYVERFNSLIPMMFRSLAQTYYQDNHQLILSVRISLLTRSGTARQAHNLKVAGSNPAPATKLN